MSLTGIMLDVSASMKHNIESGVDEESGPWAQSIFKVIDDLIKRDISSENRVFAIGVGSSCAEKEIFDVIGTIQQMENIKMPSDRYRVNSPATEDRINKILNILEKNGARNIRMWVKDVTLIQDIASDYMASLVLRKLESDKQFLLKFVNEFLPPGCRDYYSPPPSSESSRFSRVAAEDSLVRAASRLKSATGEEIYKVLEKAKCYFLRDVETNSIFSAKDASCIIRGCIDEKELSAKRKQELLGNVEPFIYGRTPLYKSLEKAIKLFEGDTSENKLLFVLSDGDPTDSCNEDILDRDRMNDITYKLTAAGVKIVSCFITRSTDIHPKRLYDEMPPGWEPGAKFLFSLSSEVPTQHLPQAILVERGWTIDIANNETKLFIQVNHPDNLRYIKFNKGSFRK